MTRTIASTGSGRRLLMRAAWLCIVLATACGTPAPVAPALATPEPPPGPGVTLDLASDLRVHGLRDDVWRIEHRRPWSANSMLVRVADDEFVLCDTPNDEVATGQLLDWIEHTFARPRLHAVASHYHVDASGGLATLRERGAATYCGTLTAQLLEEHGARMGERLAADESLDAEVRARFAAIRWVTPQHVLAGVRRPLPIRSEPVVVIHPGAAHAPDNMVTWFPERGVLFGGCMVKGGADLGNLTDADTSSWPAAAQALLDLQPTLVVPGHGAHGDAGLLQNTLDLLAAHADGPP